jgi:hypothetical protein
VFSHRTPGLSAPSDKFGADLLVFGDIALSLILDKAPQSTVMRNSAALLRAVPDGAAA